MWEVEIMYSLLIFIGVFLCVLQFFLAKKGKVKTSLFTTILFSVIVLLMILFGLATLKAYLTVIAIILWGLFVWALTKKK